MRRPLLSLAPALGLAFCASAHDFWVQPDVYWPRAQAATPVTLQVGHGTSRQRSPIPLERITRFEAIAPNGARIELRSQLHPGAAREDGEFQLTEPGAYVLVLETDARAQSHLPAARFNDFLQSEGLTPALEERARRHRTTSEGSENYSRRAKTLVELGLLERGSQTQVTRPVGLLLEIVPEQSPYALPRPATLAVRVLYEGRPLPGALVKLTNLEHDTVPLETTRTDGIGRAIFPMPERGAWLLNVVWTRPQPRSAETDFETVFSSLTFGFPSGDVGTR
jgi:uncharacterized GH25 family protein